MCKQWQSVEPFADVGSFQTFQCESWALLGRQVTCPYAPSPGKRRQPPRGVWCSSVSSVRCTPPVSERWSCLHMFALKLGKARHHIEKWRRIDGSNVKCWWMGMGQTFGYQQPKGWNFWCSKFHLKLIQAPKKSKIQGGDVTFEDAPGSFTVGRCPQSQPQPLNNLFMTRCRIYVQGIASWYLGKPLKDGSGLESTRRILVRLFQSTMWLHLAHWNTLSRILQVGPRRAGWWKFPTGNLTPLATLLFNSLFFIRRFNHSRPKTPSRTLSSEVVEISSKVRRKQFTRVWKAAVLVSHCKLKDSRSAACPLCLC